MRLFTVLSFVHYNPGWTVRVWYPTQVYTAQPWRSPEQHAQPDVGTDWFNVLYEYAIVEPFDVAQLGLPPDTPEVIKSDCLRWHLLYTQGGLWSDFDIVYVKSMWALDDEAQVYLARQHNRRHQSFYPIGFLLAAPECQFVAEVRDDALVHYDVHDYQSAGRFALERCLRRYDALPTGMSLMSPARVYPVSSWRDRRLYGGGALGLAPETVGIHWYAGSPRIPHYMATIDDSNLHEYHGPLLDHVRRVYGEIVQAKGVTTAKERT
jgi:hypothetical protein